MATKKTKTKTKPVTTMTSEQPPKTSGDWRDNDWTPAPDDQSIEAQLWRLKPKP